MQLTRFNGASVSTNGAGVVDVRTPDAAWAYAVTIPIAGASGLQIGSVGWRVTVELECISGTVGLFLTDAGASRVCGEERILSGGSQRSRISIDALDPKASTLCVRTGPSGPGHLRVHALQSWPRRIFDATNIVEDLMPELFLEPGAPLVQKAASVLTKELGRVVSQDEIVGLECRRDQLAVPFRALFSDDVGRIVLNETDCLTELLSYYDHRRLPPQTEDRVFDCGNDVAQSYLRQSVIRVHHVAKIMRQLGSPAGTLLEVGAYFGQFVSALQRLGYHCTAMDRYGSFNGALDAYTKHMRELGVNVVEATWADEVERLESLPQFDVVIAMAVIEHIPHTPREFLEALARRVRPGGLLVLDTPNVAHYWNRRRFAQGLSLQPELARQYYAPIPFEGHHREYTAAEMVWMMEQVGCADVALKMFDYNVMQYDMLTADHIKALMAFAVDPSLADTILVAGRPGA